MPPENKTASPENKVDVKLSTTDYDMGANEVEVARTGIGKGGVETWLAAMGIKGDLDKAQQTKTGAAPSTPTLKPLSIRKYAAQLCEDVSPTDTNFSTDPIFDSPYSPADSSCIFARPNTDASSLDDEDEAHTRKELLSSVELSDDSGLESASSITLPGDSPLGLSSSLSFAPIATTSSPKGFDPHATHLVYLTSCLQCVLSSLPCSRTLPACSRCLRHGHGDLCLTQRKRHHSEMYCADNSVDIDPILLVSEGDDQETFHKKAQLQNEVRIYMLFCTRLVTINPILMVQ